MSFILYRKFWRDLYLRKGMLMAIIAIISIGCACFVAMLSTLQNLENARLSYYSRSRMADFWVDLKKAPSDIVAQLENITGISEIRTRITCPVIVDIEAKYPVSGQLLSLPLEQKSIINNIVLKRGSYFSTYKHNEVIISEKFAVARNLKIGSYINIIVRGQRKKMLIIATAMSCEYMYLVPPGSIASSPKQYGLFYVKRSYAEEILGFNGACNSVVGFFTPRARQNSKTVLEQINYKLKNYGVFQSIPRKQQFSHLTLTSEMDALKSSATILPIIFFFVAAMILNILMNRIIEQQRTIIGTLKALGYHDKQIVWHYVYYGIFVGLCGAILGCLIGYWLGQETIAMYRSLFEFPSLKNDIYPEIIIIAFLISLFFAIIGTLRGVQKVIVLSASQAMRQRMPAGGGHIFLEKWNTIWCLLNFRWQMILRNIWRNKGRNLINIISAAMGASLVVLALGMDSSFQELLEFQYNKVTQSDYNLNTREEQGRNVLRESSSLPGIINAEPILNIACTFYRGNASKKGMITALMTNATMTVPHDNTGRRIKVPDVGLLMSRRLAEYLHVKTGQSIHFITIKGRREEHRATVIKIIDSALGLAVYANIKYLNSLLKEDFAISQIQLRSQQNNRERRQFYHSLQKLPQLASISEIAHEKYTMQHELIAKLTGVTWIMILFSGVIFLGSIINSSLISISERKGEIATLRAIGYHPKQIGGIFLRENMLLHITGTLFGLPIGYAMLQGMSQEFQNDTFTMMVTVYPSTWVWTIIIAIIFVFFAHIIVQKIISSMVWLEALQMCDR